MSRYIVPEAMTRFRCNEKGCCCKGWRINWEVDEVIALLRDLPPARRDGLMRGARILMDGGVADSIELRRDGPDDACQLLTDDGRCGVHVERGPEVLPGLCQRYPAYGIATDDGIELHFDAICPEVLAQIDESDAPYALVSRAAPTGDHLDLRATRPLAPAAIAVGDRPLTHAQLIVLRERILAHLSRADRAAIDKLADISYALARVAKGEPIEAFEVDTAGPVEPFEAYLDTCVAMHHEAALARFFGRYRRFVFDLPVADADPTALPRALAPDPRWREDLDPRDPRFDAFIARYLAHRYYNAYGVSRVGHQVGFTYGTVAQALAIGFRYSVGLARWLGRPVDRATLKVGVGASEYLFRTLDLPPVGMPWFGLDVA